MIRGVTGWDYLLLCLRYNSECLFLVEGHDLYVYQIICKKKDKKQESGISLTGRGKIHFIKFCSDYSGHLRHDYLIKYAYFDNMLFKTVCFYQ